MQSWGDAQWWIDTAGKLVPAFIALLVLQTTRAQNRSINAVSLRAAQVEDQKLRLALLERRLEALDQIREAVADYQARKRPTDAARGKLAAALRLAELIFSEELERSIAEAVQINWRWSALNRLYERTEDAESRARLLEELVGLDLAFGEAAIAIVQQLKAASRMRDIPPLSWPHSRLRNGLASIRAKMAQLKSS